MSYIQLHEVPINICRISQFQSLQIKKRTAYYYKNLFKLIKGKTGAALSQLTSEHKLAAPVSVLIHYSDVMCEL